MQDLTHNKMSYVHKYALPGLFTTVRLNPTLISCENIRIYHDCLVWVNKTASHARCPATAVISSKWQISHVKSKESCFSLLFSNINEKMSKLKCKKNNFRILRKQYAYLQTILKTTVKFQKDSPKTVGGVADTRYILHIHICSIRARKMSKLKMRKKW